MSFKTVVVNSDRMNYDKALDMSVLSPDEVVEYLSTEPDQFAERLQGADCVVTKEIPITRDIIMSFPDSVKLLCEAGTGFNNVDLDACKERGITVCNIPIYSMKRMAHTTIMMILSLASTMRVQMAMLARGDKSNFKDRVQVPLIEVNGKTLGVVGEGHIGAEVVKIAEALDMNILVNTIEDRPDREHVKYVDLETLLRNSDFVTLHTPLMPATRHIMNEETIGMMKPTAFLVNCSRGGLVDEKALIKALKEHKIAGAGLDVQEVEPPADENPLYEMENVILTPHMGWRGIETRQRMVDMVADNIKAYIAGKPTNVIV